MLPRWQVRSARQLWDYWDTSSTAVSELSTIPAGPGCSPQNIYYVGPLSARPNIDLYVILPRQNDAPISRQCSNQEIKALLLPWAAPDSLGPSEILRFLRLGIVEGRPTAI